MPVPTMVPVKTFKTKLMCDCGKEMKYLKTTSHDNIKSYHYKCDECNIVFNSKIKFPRLSYVEDTKATLPGCSSQIPGFPNI